jgi:single-strand DNA-binding protein
MPLYENEIKLKGFLGGDAQIFTTKQQRPFVVLSLATKSGYKDKHTNQWVNQTDWHRIVAFGKVADIAKDLKKRDYVEVVGEMRSSLREVEIVKDKKKSKTKLHNWEVRPSIIKKLAPPKAGENLDAEPITEGDAA